MPSSLVNHDLIESCIPHNTSFPHASTCFPIDSSVSPQHNSSVLLVSPTPQPHSPILVSYYFSSSTNFPLPFMMSPLPTLPIVPSNSPLVHLPIFNSIGSYIPIELIIDLVFVSNPSMPFGHPMQTRCKSGIHKSKKLYLTIGTFFILPELATYDEAKGIPEWEFAMQKEFEALLDNKTWVLVRLPPRKKTIGYT